MELIYMNGQKEDIGVMKDFTFDLAFGSDENNFECEIDMSNHCCEAGFYLYMEGVEYGGIVDSVEIDTDKKYVRYEGRTWHGIIDTKVIEPDVGEDYLILSGEANNVLGQLISRLGLGDLFTSTNDVSNITITNYKMDRYITGYEGIRKMLKSVNSKLHIEFHNGMVVLSAVPIVNYAEDEQFDTDQISFKITKIENHINHVICLGKGDLKEREVIHLYTDAQGQIVSTQVLTGLDEVTHVYDYPNAESSDELREGGVKIIEESWNSNNIEFDFNSNSESFDIGDIVGASERITGIEVNADITKKIVKIQNNNTNISYKVGD